MNNMLNHFSHFWMNEIFGFYTLNGWINIFNNLSSDKHFYPI